MKDILRVKIQGGAGVTLNVLKRSGVRYYRAKCGKNCVTVGIEKKYFKKAEEALAASGRTYEVEARSGLLYFLKRIPLRLGVFLGFVAAIIGASYYSRYVFSMELQSTDTDVSEITEVLREQGVSFPVLAEEIDEKALERAILAVDGVSHATVAVDGTRLKVKVMTEFRHEPIIDMNGTASLVATRDAIITRVVCTSGTALVKAGDIVRAGEILIAPYIKIGEEGVVPTAALGEVYGEVLRQKNLILPDNSSEPARTGRTETVSQIKLGALTSEVAAPSFSQWESETRRVILSSAIPVCVDYITYYETENRTVKATYSEGYKEETAAAFEEFSRELPEGIEIVNSYTKIKRLDNFTVVELYYHTEERIYESKDG